MALVLVTRVGFIKLPLFVLQYIDTNEIKKTIEEFYHISPNYSRKLFRYYARVINGAEIVSGHIQIPEDVFPLIDEFEKETGLKFSDEQVETVASEVNEMLHTDDEKGYIVNDVEVEQNNDDELEQIHENMYDNFLQRNWKK